MQAVSTHAALTGAAPLNVRNDKKPAVEEAPMPLTKADREWLEEMLEQREAALMSKVGAPPQSSGRVQVTVVLALIISAVSVIVSLLGFATAASRNSNSDVSAFAAWQAETNMEKRQMKERLDKLESEQAKKLDTTMEGILNWLESQPQNRSRIRIPRRTSRLEENSVTSTGTDWSYLRSNYVER